MAEKINSFIVGFDHNWDGFWKKHKYMKTLIESGLKISLGVLYASFLLLPFNPEGKTSTIFVFLTLLLMLFKDFNDFTTVRFEYFISILEPILISIFLAFAIKESYTGFINDFAKNFAFAILGIITLLLVYLICHTANSKDRFKKIHLLYPIFMFIIFFSVPYNSIFFFFIALLYVFSGFVIHCAHLGGCAFTEIKTIGSKLIK